VIQGPQKVFYFRNIRFGIRTSEKEFLVFITQTHFSEHEDKLWRDTEKFKETIQKKDTELRRNEDAKRKMAADLKTKLQEKERGLFIARGIDSILKDFLERIPS